MTQLFKGILSTDKRGETLRQIKNGWNTFIGPLTVPELWERFSDNKYGNIAAQLPLRDSTEMISIHLASIAERQPTSSVTDNLLRLSQQNSEIEIYEGARQDLGLL